MIPKLSSKWKIRLSIIVTGALCWLALAAALMTSYSSMSEMEFYLCPLFVETQEFREAAIKWRAINSDHVRKLLCEARTLKIELWLIDHWLDTTLVGAAITGCAVFGIEALVRVRKKWMLG